MTINFCIFGAGRIGAIHAGNVSRNPGAKVRYVVDPFPDAAERLACRHGAMVVSANQALEDPKVHAVIIASSTDTHADLMELSARAGKAIFCEKPIDIDVSRVRHCLAVIEDSKVVCSIGFNRRYDPQFYKMKQELCSGRIGELEMLLITSRDPSPPPIDYVKASGGMFRDMMIHDFDMARWLLGEEPVELFARGENLFDPGIGEVGDVDTAMVVMRTASGRLCHINNSRRTAYGYDQRVEAFGSSGMLKVNNELDTYFTVTDGAGTVAANPENFFLERYARAYEIEINSFILAVDSRTSPLVSPKDGLRALLLAEAALESQKTGLPISLPLK